MEESSKNPPPLPPPPDPNRPHEKSPVNKLCEGEHRVEAGLRPIKTAQALKERIDLGCVHIKFTETRGGTELGVRVDRDTLDLSQAVLRTRQAKFTSGESLHWIMSKCDVSQISI